MDAITLDQFAVFLAITEEGSFAGAARKLGRAQSAVTYAVQKLEDQIGVQLFDRSSYRAALTDEGTALLPRARRIMDDLGDFRLQAKSIAQGVEAEVTLLVDSFLPLSMFAVALKEFHKVHPFVRLRINSPLSDDVATNLLNREAELGISAVPFRSNPKLDSAELTDIELVAVAAPDHPLAQQKGLSRPRS